jgi:hypothetical protein
MNGKEADTRPAQIKHRPPAQTNQRQEAGSDPAVAYTLASPSLFSLPNERNARPLRQAAVLQMQQSHGNAAVQRLLAGRIQREGEGEGQPTPAAEGQAQPTEFRETTVPVPEAQQAAAQAAGEQAAAESGATGGVRPEGPEPAPAAETPPVPQEARVRIPIQLDFDLLPPELKIRLLEELNFTATVSSAQLQWQRRRFSLGLSYDYGGAITGSGRVNTGVGTFTGSAAFDPGNTTGSFRAGWRRGQWRVGAGVNTRGSASAQVGYGAELPPMPDQLGQHMTAAEAGGRNLLNAVPGVLSDPRTLPGVISERGEDIEAISQAAEDIGRIADLRRQDSNQINWGFYIRAAAGPQSGVGLTAGAGLFFKRVDDVDGEALGNG